MFHTFALGAVLTASVVLAAPSVATPPQDPPIEADQPAALPPDAVAVAEGLAPVTVAELDETLLWRHALTQPGRAALRQLLEVRVLDALAAEKGVTVTPADLNARFMQLDAEARQSGETEGLEAFIVEQGVDREQFREYLRLAIVHERLTREALGLDKDAVVTAAQQDAWLRGALEARPYSEEPFPYTDGVVARSGDVAIARDDYLQHIRGQMENEVLRETCYLMLLERAVRRRLPDLSDEGVVRALDAELGRRRVEAGDDPRYQGVTYEQLLEAKGLSLDALRRDPAIRSAALAHMFVDRSQDEAALRATYEAERDFFDGLYGMGVEVRAMMLNATERPNEILRRSFEEADARLNELKRQIETAADFERIAKEVSDDRATRERGGLLGTITRGNVQLPAALRTPIFEHLDSHEGDVSNTILGPLRLPGGSVLVMLGARRPAPTWEGMRENVHRELRRRFLEECLPRNVVHTAFD
ncbi:MAG: peptidylprolyl isomerase [Planctomycetota bacterium]